MHFYIKLLQNRHNYNAQSTKMGLCGSHNLRRGWGLTNSASYGKFA